MKTKRKDIKNGPSLYNEIGDWSTAANMAQLKMGHCGLILYLPPFGFKDRHIVNVDMDGKMCYIF